uniref:Abscisic acid G-protein coupled receptor, putative n=1 Tax=Theileria annulata TaxID=5874 RepID=A0A3B0N158_THEAN
MAYTLLLKVLLLLTHLVTLLLGALILELILFFRKNNEKQILLSTLSTTSFFNSLQHEDLTSFRSHFLTSWQRFGTIVFASTCFCSIGFISTLCTLHFAEDTGDSHFLKSFWTFDALLCSFILFFVIPLGLSNKYVSMKKSLQLSQKILRPMAFMLIWIAIGVVFGNLVLHDMFGFMENNKVGFTFTCIYYMCGFGLFFVALLVGFSGIYFPYLLYIIKRDVSSVRQLERLISDCNKAKRDLKLKMIENNVYFSEDESEEEDDMVNIDPESPTRSKQRLDENTPHSSREGNQLLTSYLPAEMCVNLDPQEFGNRSVPTSRVESFFGKLRSMKLRVSSTLYRLKYSKHIRQPPSGPQITLDSGFNMWLMMNQLKNDIEYLNMLKREKKASSKLSGKIFIIIKAVVASGCMINCYKICKRGILMLFSNYSSKLTRIENQKIITKVYYVFMRDEIVSSIINEVLENVQLPTAFDFLISRANSIFLACVMISSVGYFLDFARVMLKTKYLQKTKLLSDNTLGLAFACFMVLTFPSQFFLVIPFLPKQLKLTLLDYLFQNDIFVWFGMRYRFDIIVLATILLTFVGVVCLHYSRSFNKFNYQVGCNI